MENKITVSPKNMSTTNNGKFEGWGTSLCWWANRIGYSDELAQFSADLFYGKDGLALNIMRYNIGGGDDPTHKHITRTDSAVPGWLVYDESKGEYVYDYDADHNQINVMERCCKASGDDAYVEVFSNSPPYFMTESGCSSGNVDPNVNNLKPEYYGEFADYLAEVSAYINNDLGIKIKSVSPMNEPNTDFWHANSEKQEGCHVDPGEAQSSIIVETARAFKEKGLNDIIIVGSDEFAPHRQVLAYKSYSDEARAVIGRISTHTYETGGIEELGQLAKNEKINLWMSETDWGDVAGEDAGEMGGALWFGQKIISDINGLSPSAWVTWQVIDNHISKDGYNGNKDYGMVDVNGGFWGVSVADHDKCEIVLTQKYYAFGQFSRYIRPGATLIHCGEDALGAYDKENNQLTVVVLNKSAADKTMTIDLSDFSKIGESVEAIRTSGGVGSGESWAHLDDIPTDSSGFTADLKGNSITTFIVKGVVL